ncbi:hypothetical protein CDL15_Pgr026307 [Punica granatum]|uniref:Uncharacterized protein n=1 Tax=Punica granatum TaxID=22663 RepID=A0A218XW01_PUNGR|nr:hypothetical protein CDL15_Pgr026307 [Punica granatum]
MGVHLTAGVNPCILLAWGNVLPKLSLFSLSLHNSKWVTTTLQQAITEPKSQTFLSESLVITLWKWSDSTEIPKRVANAAALRYPIEKGSKPTGASNNQ